ncbi:MAG: helix-turn-helix domain-containing protein [Actinomycetota bacterium]|nr:helix-turn-helix domain-containing protein [Actinomycetota bacterium]
MPATMTGIGPALRQARRSLNKSLEEASRDTRIRPEYLRALEAESFHAMGEEVYVRSFLRSYSSYLGLDPDKVMAAYARFAPAPPEEPPPPVPAAVQERGLPVLHRHGNWKLAVVLAVVLIGVFGAVGLLSRSSPVPAAGAFRTKAAASAPSPPLTYVTVSLSTDKAVRAVVVTVDGAPGFSGTLQPAKRLSFQGTSLIHVWIPVGGAVDVVANGHDLGTPGDGKSPFEWSFKPQDFRGTPSANGP